MKAVNGPVPVVLVMGWVSLVTTISVPITMATACDAVKPVPATVTELPWAWDVGVKVIDPAPLPSGIGHEY